MGIATDVVRVEAHVHTRRSVVNNGNFAKESVCSSSRSSKCHHVNDI